MLVRQPENFILPSNNNNNNNNKYDNKNIKAYAVWIQQNVDLNVSISSTVYFTEHMDSRKRKTEDRASLISKQN